MKLKKSAHTDELVRGAVAQLLARADDTHALDAEAVMPRVRASLDKYLLRDYPDASPREVEQFIERLHADDLMLVVACERGDEAAWSGLMERYRSTVLSAARGASASESEAAELAQSVWAELYGLRERPDGRPAGKLAYYSGCGSLGGWLRAVVGQMGVDRHRRSSRLVQTEEAADFDRLAGEARADEDGIRGQPALDPEQALARTEAAQSVHAALAQALGELAPEDRLLVKLYYFDGLRLREAGAVLGVHEATASRRLTRVHAEIRRRVEALLIAEHGWTSGEAARSLTEVVGHFDTDLASALAVEGAPVEHHDKRR
ncbi:MAG: sigma-70 family RNA polymerase sigma factor [Pyrinomonadaceae bacterium]|nr:sigma-70 family RNA polymerase sigma factor [Pyrinomonadaceae bacterium]